MKNVKSMRRNATPLAMVISTVLGASYAGNAVSCPVTDRVHDIQGNSLTQLAGGAHNDQSPLTGHSVTVEGIVVGTYQSTAQLRGFFLQEEAVDEDADPTTSEGIFVFSGSSPALTVTEGERVCVTGLVAESLGMTRINATASGASMTLSTAGDNLAEVATPVVSLPATGDLNDFYEQYEGMRVRFAGSLAVSDSSDLDRFGAVTLVAGARPLAYTQEDATPTAAEYAAWRDALTRRSVLLDDDDDTQYAALPAGILPYPQPAGFGVGTQGSDFFRAGDTINGLTGIVTWTNGGLSGANAWRVRPVTAAPVSFAVDNPRAAATPATVGDVRVVEFNLADYFSTIDTTGGVGAPAGADSSTEFERQSTKLVAALAALDADVIAVMEVENDGGFTLQELANRLNAQTGSADYDAVAVSALGLEPTAVGLVYRTSAVQTAGSPAVLADVAFTAPNGGTEVNPPALAQTFSVVGGAAAGERFTVVVTQLKSRTSTGAFGWDLDQADGQGVFNDSRTKATQYLVGTWLASDPTAQGVSEVLVVGDLSAYRYETPLDAFESAGFGDLVALYQGADAYTQVLGGVTGYLDHALASASLTDHVVNTAVWHINADEVEAFDYNDTLQDSFGEQFAERKPSGRNLYAADEFRSSDHDPVIVDLAFAPPPPPPPPAVMRGDADGDGDIDRDDLKLINRTKREPAAGADDPSDVDGDGYISVDDVKLARDLCTRPHCATEADAGAGDAPGRKR